MSSNEYVVYNDKPKPTLTIAKSLELQRWIIDPTSVPYDHQNDQNRLIALSASARAEENDKKSVVQKQMELQQMILGDT